MEVQGNGPIDIAAAIREPDGIETVTSASLTVTDAQDRSLGSWDLSSFAQQEDSLELFVDDFKLSGPSPWTVTLSAEDVDDLTSTTEREVRRGGQGRNTPSTSEASLFSSGTACTSCKGPSQPQKISVGRRNAANPIRLLARERVSSLLSLTRSDDGVFGMIKSGRGVLDTFRSYRRVLTRFGFELAFVDYEGFEAELFGVRGDTIVLVRMLEGRDGSSVLVTVHR